MGFDHPKIINASNYEEQKSKLKKQFARVSNARRSPVRTGATHTEDDLKITGPDIWILCFSKNNKFGRPTCISKSWLIL